MDIEVMLVPRRSCFSAEDIWGIYYTYVFHTKTSCEDVEIHSNQQVADLSPIPQLSTDSGKAVEINDEKRILGKNTIYE
jgi:hypothetical protein